MARDTTQVYIFDTSTEAGVKSYLAFAKKKGANTQQLDMLRDNIKRDKSTCSYVRCAHDRFSSYACVHSYEKCIEVAKNSSMSSEFIDMRVMSRLEELFA
jgi:hypothetical protein